MPSFFNESLALLSLELVVVSLLLLLRSAFGGFGRGMRVIGAFVGLGVGGGGVRLLLAPGVG
jgi:hypothetical protein